MQQRESHKKSRKGCQSCKRRHCDEQGPPCANCVVRKTECVYQSASEIQKNKKTALTRRPKRIKPAPENSQESSSQASDTAPETVLFTNPPSFSLSPSPVAFSSTLQEERLLELELLHRWSTRTFTGMCSVPEDGYYLQTYLPQAGLHTSYLMNGIFAMAAIDIALSNPCLPATKTKYFRTALQYCNKATAEFRIHLQNINHENLHLLYYFAMLAAVFNFATSFEQQNTLDRMDTAFEMLLGATNIATVNIAWLIDSPSSIRNVVNDITFELLKGGNAFDSVDLEAKRALECASSVWRDISKPTTSGCELTKVGEELISSPGDSDEKYYEIVIKQLKHCFAEDARDKIKFYCFSLISLAGGRFLKDIKRRVPMALFLEIFFAVLLDRASRDPMAWWADDVGKDMVNQISRILQESVIAHIPEGQEVIIWARQQVGLPAMLWDS